MSHVHINQSAPARQLPSDRDFSSWQELYQAKLCTAQEAAAGVQSDDMLFIGGGTGIPKAFANAVGLRASELRNVTIYQGYAMDLYEYMKPEYKESFNIETMFVGPMERVCMEWGIAHYVPLHLAEIPDIARSKTFDKVAFMATPPDEDGYMNRSCFGSFCPNEECIRHSDVVVAEVNQNTPWLASDDFKIHVSEVDHIIENHAPIFALPEIPISQTEKTMAEYIADLIPDGATIQIGFGGLANAIGHLLLDKNDLGMHSEIVTPSVMELMKKGVINGSKKTFMPGKIVSAFAVGTQEFYDFINRNDDFYFKEIGWVNNPDIIAMNDNLISVNTALMIDLTGQVAAESIGTKQYSGSGGQVNFVHGARKSNGGKSIIALKSSYTNKAGTLHSKIVPTFPAGTIVTTSRNDVQYIVTEYGAVNLRYESIEKRTKKLISISHPDFRDELTFEAKKIGLI
ncbi:MAG TPA: acetyl-CoA hydrolase/transferase C-terminal domain-containing protein [Deltaproteobacteria bacterium]|nr:acetyl-CoA hydrolase/transferase C-terminal domain-containing protein [Deltaproteobacteria bacterium]